MAVTSLRMVLFKEPLLLGLVLLLLGGGLGVEGRLGAPSRHLLNGGCGEGEFQKLFDGTCMTCDDNCSAGQCIDHSGCRKCHKGYYTSRVDIFWPFACVKCEIENCEQCMEFFFDDWQPKCDKCIEGFVLNGNFTACDPEKEPVTLPKLVLGTSESRKPRPKGGDDDDEETSKSSVTIATKRADTNVTTSKTFKNREDEITTSKTSKKRTEDDEVTTSKTSKTRTEDDDVTTSKTTKTRTEDDDVTTSKTTKTRTEDDDVTTSRTTKTRTDDDEVTTSKTSKTRTEDEVTTSKTTKTREDDVSTSKSSFINEADTSRTTFMREGDNVTTSSTTTKREEDEEEEEEEDDKQVLGLSEERRKKCPKGSFLKEHDKTCMTCDVNCPADNCVDFDGCTECKEGFYLSREDDFWPFECLKCVDKIPNCAKCKGGEQVYHQLGTTCLICEEGFQLGDNARKCTK